MRKFCTGRPNFVNCRSWQTAAASTLRAARHPWLTRAFLDVTPNQTAHHL